MQISDFIKTHYKILKNSLLVPIPLHPKRHKERGFNQSQKIAELIASKTNCQVAQILKRVNHTQKQARLSKFKRTQNINNCFTFSSQINYKKNTTKIIIIDDIFSTGSTLEEAAKTIRIALKIQQKPHPIYHYQIGAFTIARARLSATIQ
ncbi:hypothetical protein KKG71_03570 [Patescibacteria group bacterium]|nr:hypothetical protein [Patescibacteria group bacterium]